MHPVERAGRCGCDLWADDFDTSYVEFLVVEEKASVETRLFDRQEFISRPLRGEAAGLGEAERDPPAIVRPQRRM